MFTMILNILMLATMAAQASYAAPLTVDDPKDVSRLMDRQDFEYITTEESLSPEQAATSPWTNQHETPFTSKSHTKHMWIKFTVQNNLNSQESLVLYHASNFTLESMDVYQVKEHAPILIGKSGIAIPTDQRALKERIPGVAIHLDKNSGLEIMIHVYTSRVFTPDFAFGPMSYFTHHIQTTNFLLGFCVGVQFLVIVITALFAIGFKDRAYGSIALLSAVMILSILFGQGYRDMRAHQYLAFLDTNGWMKLMRPLTLFLFLNLTSVFLNLRVHSPRLNQWIQAAMISTATISALSFIPSFTYYAINAVDRLIFVGMVLVITSSYRGCRKKIPLAGYFLISSLAITSSSIPLMMSLVSRTSLSEFAINLIHVGQSINMVVLCLALIAKIRLIDEARIGAEVEAGKSEELKSLLRVMSHDLNNPLTVTMAYGRKGLDKTRKAGNNEIAVYFEKIVKASENQFEIIEHIKTMRAIEDGKTSLDIKSIHLDDVLKQAESTFEHRLLEKKIALTYDPDEMKRHHVLAEGTSLNHNVFNNLISNAIKFSPEGTTIDISSASSGDHVTLIVHDHGVGMPQHLLTDIFRTDKPTSRAGTNGEKGTGFGMPVVKAYMHRFGGDIHIDSSTEVESPENHGTKVTLTFKKAG
jgi:signal transduction histidine kinase